MIRNAPALQESFAQLTVASPLPAPPAAAPTPNGGDGGAAVYVIDGLLDLILNTRDQLMFDLRYAACECLKAYLSNHAEVRLHFLGRAVEGYQQGPDESANVLTVLLRPDGGAAAADPYRQWFAAVIAFHLLHDNATAKAKALGLSEGDSEKGEEVVTGIQIITAHLISGIGRGDDPRSLVGYLMLLVGWMFEDLDAVNDFLAEGSNVQSLVQAASQPLPAGAELVQGLSAMLLGVAYEFSTKDSPVPRSTLHSILTSRLGHDGYLDRLTGLRGHPFMRDFEVTPQRFDASSPSGLADVFFDADFVNFFKDNYSRIARALDRPPELEISVLTNGIQRGISRELVDSLRRQAEDKDRELEDARAKVASLEELLHQGRAEHQRAGAELSRLRGDYESLQESHETEMRALRSQQLAKEADKERRISSLQAELIANEANHESGLAQARKAAEAEAERAQLRAEAEVADLRATISRLEVDVMKANRGKMDEMNSLRQENSKLVAEHVSKRERAEGRSRELESQLGQVTAALEEMESKVDAAESAKLDATKAKDAAQAELDDLLMVFGDLEEKVARYKARLRHVGEPVSDGEEDDDDGGEADVD